MSALLIRLFAIASAAATLSMVVMLMCDPVFPASPAHTPEPSAVILVVAYMVISTILAIRCSILEDEL